MLKVNAALGGDLLKAERVLYFAHFRDHVSIVDEDVRRAAPGYDDMPTLNLLVDITAAMPRKQAAMAQ